jgi:hypothetical protein
MLYKFINSDVEFLAEVGTNYERIIELVEEYSKGRDQIPLIRFLRMKGIRAELVFPQQIFI